MDQSPELRPGGRFRAWGGYTIANNVTGPSVVGPYGGLRSPERWLSMLATTGCVLRIQEFRDNETGVFDDDRASSP